VRVCDAEGTEVGRLRLVRARPAPDVGESSRWEPGEIMSDGSVRAGDGSGLELVEVQPDGRTPMSLADYRRGHRWTPGMRVESILT
jgi:methionyl-tRNA formyltransferase